MAQISTNRLRNAKNGSRSSRNNRGLLLVCCTALFFTLIIVNMFYMNTQISRIAPIENTIEVNTKKGECCKSLKNAKCLSCSMNLPLSKVCSQFPELIGCYQESSTKSRPNLRKPVIKSSKFADFDEFEEFILNSVTKQELIDGSFSDITDPRVLEITREYGEYYKSLSYEAMKFSYNNYEKFAFGHDELKPKTGGFTDKWGGNGVTLVDSLDTLWIMGLKDEFYRGVAWIEESLTFEENKFVSFFETTIRDLGGLLSAYYLSKEPVLLQKAEELGRKLFVTFTKDELPLGQVNLQTGETKTEKWLRGGSLLAEIGTCQLEFGALGHLLSDPELYNKPKEAVIKVETEYASKSNLFPIILGQKSNRKKPLHTEANEKKAGTGKLTMGGTGDSYYEYLLKFWVQSRFKETEFREWYEQSIQGMIDYMVVKTKPNGLALLATTTLKGSHQKREMDHLACFVPGMLALGAYHAPKGYKYKERDMTLAKQLMYTCVEFYFKNPTGLSPEIVIADDKVDFKAKPKAEFYLLRPEMVESLYILYQVTKQPIYRVWGKKIMENIDKYCKTTYGYGSYENVLEMMEPKDEMESFFLAETLKYHFLLQTEDTEINLDEWVFNTEAHPLRVFD